ncbi:hypothetical protein [Clostridium estertheticum]|uniref:hypothetical protein n=1 Tax=Clostridium estertheticum TaxID=238834 RepID=UPI001C7CC7C9|nr:hypothetical protein [Clostridium estertheticum]MBX4272139.1 hypothetical protein [Clostridium estertheticum]WLC82173.1 hypothetical protein KTC98_23535 [Clostridium estertheticum]
MKSKVIKSVVTGLVMLSISVPVFAASWFSSSITLPRTGFMTTTERNATGNIQYTKVTDNSYDVKSRIDDSHKNGISDFVTHRAGKSDQFTHNSDTVKNNTIMAQFQSPWNEYRTNTVTIYWIP